MNILEKIDAAISPTMAKLDQNRYVNALKEGMFLAMPLMLIGSALCLITSFPIQAVADWLTATLGPDWTAPFTAANMATMQLSGLVTLIGCVRSLAAYYEMNEVFTIAASVCAYVTTLPIENGWNISITSSLNTSQSLVVIITGIIAVEILHFVEKRGWTITLPKEVPAFVSNSFKILIPDAILIFIFIAIRILCSKTSYGYWPNLINNLIAAPLSGITTSLPGFYLNIFVGTFLFGFGIGGNPLGQIFQPFLQANLAENAASYVATGAGIHMIDDIFRDQFTTLGGTGCTLALNVMMLLWAKSQQNKAVAKASIVPAIFNVNEPIVFATPICFNPILFIPFVIAPIMTLTTAVIATNIGFLPFSNGLNVPWTLPIPFKALVNYGVPGLILQIINFALTFLLYFPFFKIYDNQLAREEEKKSDAE